MKSSVVDTFQTNSLAVMVQKFPRYITEKKNHIIAGLSLSSQVLGYMQVVGGKVTSYRNCFWFYFHAHGSWGKSSATSPHWQPCIAFIQFKIALQPIKLEVSARLCF